MKQISTKQLCFIIIITFTVGKFIFMPALVAGYSAENLWLNVLFNFLIDFILLVFVINFLLKHQQETFYEVLVKKFGKPFAKITAVIFTVFFILKLVIPILEEHFAIELTFYETQPSYLTFLPFFLVVCYIGVKGLNAFSRSVELTIFIFFPAIFMLLLLSLTAGNYSHLLPLFNVKVKPFLSASYNILLWFGDPLFLLFFTGKVKISNKFKLKTFLSYLANVLIVSVVIVVFYAIFYSIAKRQYYAPLKMSKYAISLSSIGRFDYFTCLMLVTASVFCLALPVVASSETLKDAFKIKYPQIFPIVVTLIVLIITTLVRNTFFATLSFMQTYFTPVIIVLTYLFPTFIIFKKENRRDI